ncbi:MAG TPA: hypothetical protein VFQ43_17495, partial [Nitrososphaera sp.]|nr:hypothetical protein [Nitrososphaera sp.]
GYDAAITKRHPLGRYFVVFVSRLNERSMDHIIARRLEHEKLGANGGSCFPHMEMMRNLYERHDDSRNMTADDVV